MSFTVHKRYPDGDFQGARLYDEVLDAIPHGAARIAAWQDAVRQADAAHDPYWQMHFRYKLLWEKVFYDDQPQVIPIAQEFMTLFDEYRDYMLPPSGANTMYLYTLEYAMGSIQYMPSIPLSQWDSLLEQYRKKALEFHLGEGSYWRLRSDYWEDINKEKALECFEKYLTYPEDAVSDCKACTIANHARLLLAVGRRAEAKRIIEPIANGTLRNNNCDSAPINYRRSFMNDALRRGDLLEAKRYVKPLLRTITNRDDVGRLGDILCCMAYTDLDNAIPYIYRKYHWVVNMMDKAAVFGFYLGAWVCCRQLAKRQETVEMRFPKTFPLYKKDRIYNCAELESWFYRETRVIAEQFDRRNGSNSYASDMEDALVCEK